MYRWKNMNLLSLEMSLKIKGADFSMVGLGQTGTRDGYYLVPFLHGYSVYWQKEGVWQNLQYFDTEHDACLYFWGMVSGIERVWQRARAAHQPCQPERGRPARGEPSSSDDAATGNLRLASGQGR
jgi:hypothetical protein